MNSAVLTQNILAKYTENNNEKDKISEVIENNEFIEKYNKDTIIKKIDKINLKINTENSKYKKYNKENINKLLYYKKFIKTNKEIINKQFIELTKLNHILNEIIIKNKKEQEIKEQLENLKKSEEYSKINEQLKYIYKILQ